MVSIISILQGEVEDFLKDRIKNRLSLMKLENTIEQTFNEDTLKGYVDKQDKNTYITDFIGLLKENLFDKIIEMLTEVNSKKSEDIRHDIFEIAHTVTDQSEMQIKDIDILLNQVIYSMEYCWVNSLDRNGKFLYSINQKEKIIILSYSIILLQ